MKIRIIHLYVAYNYVKFKLLGVKFGKHLRVFNRLYIKCGNNATINIGDYFVFTSGAGLNPIASNMRGYINVGDDAELLIGDNCGISSATLWVKEKLTIGNNVKIGGGSLIMDTDCHSLDYRVRNGCILGEGGNMIDSQIALSQPVIIEDDVLIGARSVILKGVTIGSRTVIGAGSVVTSSIPSDCIAAGNPCHVIREIGE